jgi:hypothetical protein
MDAGDGLTPRSKSISADLKGALGHIGCQRISHGLLTSHTRLPTTITNTNGNNAIIVAQPFVSALWILLGLDPDAAFPLSTSRCIDTEGLATYEFYAESLLKDLSIIESDFRMVLWVDKCSQDAGRVLEVLLGIHDCHLEVVAQSISTIKTRWTTTDHNHPL